MRTFLTAIGVLVTALSVPAQSSEMEGTGISSFVTADIDGWQLQCNLQLMAYQDPSKCFALFHLSDGEVTLFYSNKGLEIYTTGKCGIGTRSGEPLEIPVTDLARAIEGAARYPSQKCKPPILTAALFQGLPALNTMATILTQRRP